MIVKEHDTHEVSWKTNVDLAGATSVRLIAKKDATVFVLPSTVDGDTVTHQLTGTLSEGRYRVEVEATINGEVVTFPNDQYARLDVIPDLD